MLLKVAFVLVIAFGIYVRLWRPWKRHARWEDETDAQ